MQLTEKYRPNTIEGIVGHDDFVAKAQEWLKLKEFPHLLLFGPAGTGKTSVGHIFKGLFLDKHIKGNFLEINASNDRKIETIRTKVREFCETATLGDIPFKILLMDEVDGMILESQNALKRIMERAHHVRFIFTANNRDSIIAPIQSRCANYFFPALTVPQIEHTLLHIAEQESPLHIPEGIPELARAVAGDLRRAIVELQGGLTANVPLVDIIKRANAEYVEIVTLLQKGMISGARTKLTALIFEGVSVKQICVRLYDTVVQSNDLSDEEKVKLLRVIGESEWRSKSMTPRVLIGWMTAMMR